MAVKWNLATDIDGAKETQIFSGGACNIRDANGALLRNTERDQINDWLYEQGIRLFDPQIHPDTHGTEYIYELHHEMEIVARKAAKINLYEISPCTFGGVTSMEIALDRFRHLEPLVVYYSDGHSGMDLVPQHSKYGHPLFMPRGITESETARRSHYKEMTKNANNMRRYMVNFAQEIDTLMVDVGGTPRRGDVVITPDRMHAVDMFKAVARAAAGERVFVMFQGGTPDKNGIPLFEAPEDPAPAHLTLLLDQYVDEGNELRRSIARVMDVNVFVRVVYTQSSVIAALNEVLMLRKLI